MKIFQSALVATAAATSCLNSQWKVTSDAETGIELCHPDESLYELTCDENGMALTVDKSLVYSDGKMESNYLTIGTCADASGAKFEFNDAGKYTHTIGWNDGDSGCVSLAQDEEGFITISATISAPETSVKIGDLFIGQLAQTKFECRYSDQLDKEAQLVVKSGIGGSAIISQTLSMKDQFELTQTGLNGEVQDFVLGNPVLLRMSSTTLDDNLFHFHVVSCEASPADASLQDAGMSFEIVKDGCVSDVISGSMEPQGEMDEAGQSVTFNAFNFGGDGTVAISCQAKVCLTGETDCFQYGQDGACGLGYVAPVGTLSSTVSGKVADTVEPIVPVVPM